MEIVTEFIIPTEMVTGFNYQITPPGTLAKLTHSHRICD